MRKEAISYPKWMVYFMENPIKMDDLGGFPPIIFGNTHMILFMCVFFPQAPCDKKGCLPKEQGLKSHSLGILGMFNLLPCQPGTSSG